MVLQVGHTNNFNRGFLHEEFLPVAVLSKQNWYTVSEQDSACTSYILYYVGVYKDWITPAWITQAATKDCKGKLVVHSVGFKRKRRGSVPAIYYGHKAVSSVKKIVY